MALCPFCGVTADSRVLAQSGDLRPALLPWLWQENSTWQPQQGVCPACVQRAWQQLLAARNPTSLHTTTEPPTTFPYYHRAEEQVLAQVERLPDYAAFTGAGVTIAFLDSGYYPHPDLCAASTEFTPDWARLDERAWREHLARMRPRIAQYVDLADGGERLGIDQPSLWDSAGSSWHGQMTTTIAAGNGHLSGGRYRGYAPQAAILPIKIGRQNGRIPEEDILRGLEWLLRDDNWQRYGVRVLNISVGGDFRQPWHKNLVCLAAEELSQRGVLICAAAGNRGAEGLVAPAQAPSVLTVGGYEDYNQRWQPHDAADVARLTLYHHNYGTVYKHRQRSQKPEILALARWLPAPILPVSPVFAETATIGQLRNALLGYDEYLSPPRRSNSPLPYPELVEGGRVRVGSEGWFAEVWQAVRQRMNAHKWIHPYYQHVDGTSVAVAQVSGAAAQVLAANPQLSGAQIRSLLLATALPLLNPPAALTGRGVLQPAQAVTAALRATGGPLVGYLQSATILHSYEQQNWWGGQHGPTHHLGSHHNAVQPVYFGYYAPAAQAVSIVGTFTHWQPGTLSLQPARNGWWHGVVLLPPGEYRYRFWVESAQQPAGAWYVDPENPRRYESGYGEDESGVEVK